MSRSLDDLTPELHLKIVTLLQNCATRGVEFVPYFTLRSPQDQAALWRQSRGVAAIDTEIALLQSLGAPWLAQVLRDAPSKPGPWATNGVPGNSWHQWGEACDCYWKTPTGIQWTDGQGYEVYALEAQKLGLTIGRLFMTPDIDHVQWRSQGAPSYLYSWPEINAKMQEMFSDINPNPKE